MNYNLILKCYTLAGIYHLPSGVQISNAEPIRKCDDRKKNRNLGMRHLAVVDQAVPPTLIKFFFKVLLAQSQDTLRLKIVQTSHFVIIYWEKATLPFAF